MKAHRSGNLCETVKSLGIWLSALVLLAIGAVLSVGIAVPMHAQADAGTISGAGATFPMPVYSKWAEDYHKLKGLKMSYRGIGSGGGIAEIKAKTVDFGASDRPLKIEDLERDGLLQFPMIIGGVVPVVNVGTIRKGELKLTPELLSDIFLGKIKTWDDRKIKAVNSDLDLPDTEITVIHRADGSGTTWIFTTYLSKVSEEWKEKVGAGKAVSWPKGVGGKGNPGVSALVKKIDGAIGYVEFTYSIKNKLKFVKLQNQEGEFVEPTKETFTAAAENADWEHAPGFYMDLTDQPGDKTWPITGTSYILIYRDQMDKDKALAMLKFFDWAFKKGGDIASKLHYVPIPEKVYNLAQKEWSEKVTFGGHIIWENNN